MAWEARKKCVSSGEEEEERKDCVSTGRNVCIFLVLALGGNTPLPPFFKKKKKIFFKTRK